MPVTAADIALAERLADAAGAAILPYFRGAHGLEAKDDQSPVTLADRAAEEAMRKLIIAERPMDGIQGEEFGVREGTSGRIWVLDPIDGTRAFITGSPMWGTLIGLLEGGGPVLGLIDHPFTSERLWSAERGAFRQTRRGSAQRISTRHCSRLDDAFVMTTSPDLFEPGYEMDGFLKVKSRARMVRFGGDCYAYSLLAQGLIDLVIEAGLKPYDVVALIPVIEKAGGRISTWDGKPATQGGRIVAAGDPALHERVVKLLNR